MESLLSSITSSQLLSVLAILAFTLLIVVTGGVAYLTAIEWRDKRRRIREAQAMPSSFSTRKRKR